MQFVLIYHHHLHSFRNKRPSIPTVKEKSGEFEIGTQNKHLQLVDEENGDIKSLNDNLTNIVFESALVVGGKAPKENNGKLSAATKEIIRKRCRMVIKTGRDKIELVEQSKTINKRKTDDIRKYNMKMNKDTLKK